MSEEWTTRETRCAEVTAVCPAGVARRDALGRRRRTYRCPRQARCTCTPGTRVGSRMAGCRDRPWRLADGAQVPARSESGFSILGTLVLQPSVSEARRAGVQDAPRAVRRGSGCAAAPSEARGQLRARGAPLRGLPSVPAASASNGRAPTATIQPRDAIRSSIACRRRAYSARGKGVVPTTAGLGHVERLSTFTRKIRKTARL